MNRSAINRGLVKRVSFLVLAVVIAGAIALYIGGGAITAVVVFVTIVAIWAIAPAYHLRIERNT